MYPKFELEFGNIREMIIDSAEKNKEKILYYEKVNGDVIGHSHEELKEDVFALGTKLLNMGLKGKHIGIIGENTYRWIVSYLAIINGIGVAVPLDKELYEEQISDLLNKGDASALIFSKTFLSGMDIIKENCPQIDQYICMQDNKDGYASVDALIEEGKEVIKDDNSYLNQDIDIDELNVIMFTSGTTGANKGVMISQRNLLSNIKVASDLFRGYKSTFSVLPFHHAYENVCGILTPINIATTVYINDSLKYLADNMRKFKPEMSTMVPLFLETMDKSIDIQVEKMNIEKLYKYSIKASNLLRKVGIDLRRLMFKKVHDTFGGNFRTIVCGGALLRPELVKKFRDIGIQVINGFGITECTPLVSVNTVKNADDNSIGQIVPSCEVMILDPDENGIGEILVRGSNVMLGYYKDEESTEKSFYEDWFRTGDIGYKNGNSLYMTGRKKNLIVLSNGKNVHPEELEGYILKEMPYVQEAIVYTDINKKGSSIIIASVYLNDDYLQRNNIDDVENIIDMDLRKVNSILPSYKQIQKIYIRDEEFEKNTSKKIMRYKFLKEVSNIG